MTGLWRYLIVLLYCFDTVELSNRKGKFIGKEKWSTKEKVVPAIIKKVANSRLNTLEKSTPNSRLASPIRTRNQNRSKVKKAARKNSDSEDSFEPPKTRKKKTVVQLPPQRASPRNKPRKSSISKIVNDKNSHSSKIKKSKKGKSPLTKTPKNFHKDEASCDVSNELLPKKTTQAKNTLKNEIMSIKESNSQPRTNHRRNAPLKAVSNKQKVETNCKDDKKNTTQTIKRRTSNLKPTTCNKVNKLTAFEKDEERPVEKTYELRSRKPKKKVIPEKTQVSATYQKLFVKPSEDPAYMDHFQQDHKELNGICCPADFKPQKELGKGGFGVVLLAFHKPSQKQVAVKYIKKIGDPNTTKKLVNPALLEEERILKTLNHPNVIKYYCTMPAAGGGILQVIEYCPGKTLFDLAFEKKPWKPMPQKQLAQITFQLLKAIRYLHAQGIVHRDIKLENLIVDESEGYHVKLIDFGLAERIKNKKGLTRLVGTTEYFAPERIRQTSYGLASDLYAVGVVVTILVIGEYPFEINSFRNLERWAKKLDKDEFQLIPEIPSKYRWANLFIKKLTLEEPYKRWAAVYDLSRSDQGCLFFNPNLISMEFFKPLELKSSQWGG